MARRAATVAQLYQPTLADGLVAGVDEAGRGPLAGPVSVAAVVLDPRRIPAGLNDSKKLSPSARQRLFVEINEMALHQCVIMVSPADIDALNILHATMHGMRCAVEGLTCTLSEVVIDGNRAPDLTSLSPRPPVRTLIGGDALHASVAAASILAKCTRDAAMVEYDEQFPGYGFAKHKGYPTVAHRDALQTLGPCAIHRHSFAPVRAAAARHCEGC
ncbi:MAG: ribonuclease HII [Pseudomonadota bacterium]